MHLSNKSQNSFEFNFQNQSPIYTLLPLFSNFGQEEEARWPSPLSHTSEDVDLATAAYLAHLVGGCGDTQFCKILQGSHPSLSLHQLLQSTPNQLLPPPPAMHQDPMPQLL
jgi:hypothetical protein